MLRLGASLRVFGFVVVTLPLMPVQMLFLALFPDAARRFPYFYHRMLCRILGFKLKHQGKFPPATHTLLISNHVSWIDIVVLSAVMPVSFVAKQEVAGWPFFGWLAKLQRTVFINRENRHSTGKSSNVLAARLEAGDCVVLFPEGTSHDGASVLPFKSSFFAAASLPHINVVPVTLAYLHQWNLPLTRRNRPHYAWYGDMDLLPHLWRALCAGPLTVEVVFHDGLDGNLRANRKAASESAERIISGSLAQALHGRPILG